MFRGSAPRDGRGAVEGPRTGPPAGRAARDLPPQPGVFAPTTPGDRIAQRLRKDAGLPDEPLGEVANGDESVVDKVKDKLG